MEIKNKIDKLLKNQKEVLKQYEELIKEINIDESLNENDRLKKKVEDCEKSIEEFKKRQVKLSNENMSLNIALKEQMINEKTGILNNSQYKLGIYFKDETKKHANKLKQLEDTAKSKLGKLKNIANKDLREGNDEILAKIKNVELALTEEIRIHNEKFEKERGYIIDEIKSDYDALNKDGLSEDVIMKKKRYNDIEVKIGLNWVNKAGIILLLLGIATLMKYTYTTWLNDYMKALSGFILGGFLLVAGEWFNREKNNVFALGLIGGGIGTLYLSVFSSYFILNILTMTVSLSISVLITLVSLVLSLRYKSTTICGLSLIGGYFPFFTYVFSEGLSGNAIYLAMGYLFILNLLVLGISLGRRWIYIKYLSFSLNIPCIIYLSFSSSNELISSGYSLATFMMYLAITLYYPLREKFKLRVVDIILLGLNTVVNCLLIYTLFEQAGYGEYKGIIALVYALIYLALGQLVQKSASQEIAAQALFYLTAVTFSVLMIPFHFGLEWASLGWLIESILIISYAFKRDLEKMELAGWVILILSVGKFMATDLLYIGTMENFTLKYTLITLGLVVILAQYVMGQSKTGMPRFTLKGRLLAYYKYFTIVSVWIYFMRMTLKYYDIYIQPHQHDRFYFLIIIALISGFYAYFIAKIKQLQDFIVHGISIALFIFVDLLCIFLNFNRVGVNMDPVFRTISIAVLIMYNVFVLLNIKELTIKLIKYKVLSLEIYPMAMGIYFIGSTVAILVNQFDLGNINLIISIFLIVMALVFIALGFKKHFVILRRSGLVLSVFSIGKLFIYDLAFLEIGGKIIAYFCFGLTLILISYVYDKLTKNIDNVER